MECEETLTMVLPPETDIRSWKTNPDVSIKAPDADQLEQHELKYYGPLYGDDFTVRNNRNLREKADLLGAYAGRELVVIAIFSHPMGMSAWTACWWTRISGTSTSP